MTKAPQPPSREVRFIHVLGAFWVLIALGCVAWGQWLIESVRLTNSPPPPLGFWLLLAGGGLGALATWGRGASETEPGFRPFDVTLPAGRWLVALVPGIAALVAAAVVQQRTLPSANHELVFWLWLGGIALLVTVGGIDAITAGIRNRDRANEDWSRPKLILSYGLLIFLSLAFRLAYNLEDLPGFVENDEVWTGLSARGILTANPYAWFDLWWIGLPNFGLVPVRVAELIFGDNLWGIRMGGVMMGTISIVCTFAFSRRLVGNFIGLLTAILLAVAHTHIHWSRNGQIFIETPAFAAIILAVLVRVWTGGSLLSWILAGVVLGLGTQNYQASYVFPVLVGVTMLGWTMANPKQWKQIIAATVIIELVAILVLAPVGMSMLRDTERAAGRAKVLSILEPRNLLNLEMAYRKSTTSEIVVEHFRRALLVFNWCNDFFPAYGARRSLVDFVTAAMVPVAAAMLLVRPFSPIAWLFWTWISGYLVVGVLFASHPPTYHRIPTMLLFSSLGVAWSFVTAARAITDGFSLPRWVAAGLGWGFVAAASAANAHYYLWEFRLAKPTYSNVAFSRIICRYAETHLVADANVIGEVEYIPAHNVQPEFECPQAKRISINKLDDLWNIDKYTNEPLVVYVIPKPVIDAHPGEPHGYRIVHSQIDTAAKFPRELPLVVLELERIYLQ